MIRGHTVFEDYPADLSAQMEMPASGFFYCRQDLLMQLAETFKVPNNTSPDDDRLQKLIEAYVAYRRCLLNSYQETIPSFMTEAISKPSPRGQKSLILKARGDALQKNYHVPQRNKNDEWNDVVLLTAHALEDLFDPYVRFARLMTPETFEIFAELLGALRPSEPPHTLRCTLLHEFVKVYHKGDETIDLLQKVIKSDETHPVHAEKGIWIQCLREYEEDILLTICLHPDFKKSTRCDLIALCLGNGDDAKGRELAATMCVRSFTGSYTVESFLVKLHAMFTSNTKERFDQLRSERIQALFLWLLLGSTLKDDKNRDISCHLVLLYALPYCIDHLQGLATDSLKSSLNGSDGGITRALCQTMNELSLTGSIAPTSNEWNEINKLLCRVIAPRTEKPFCILKESLCYWYARTVPSGRRIARVLAIFEQFAQGFLVPELDICHRLLKELVIYDNKLLQFRKTSLEAHEHLLIQVLASLLNKDPLSPVWLKNLEGKELESFLAVAESIRCRKYLSEIVFPICITEESGEKGLSLAIRLCPYIPDHLLLTLYYRCCERGLKEIFIQTARAPNFPEKRREWLFHQLYYSDPEGAARFYQIIPGNTLLLLLNRLSLVTEPYPNLLKYLCFDAPWAIDSNSKEKVISLFLQLVKKCGLDTEISLKELESKLK